MEVSLKPLISNQTLSQPQAGSALSEQKQVIAKSVEQDTLNISAEAYAAFAGNVDVPATTMGTGVTPPPPPPPPGSEPVED